MTVEWFEVGGCLCSLLNVILRRGANTGHVTSVVYLALLWKACRKHQALEEQFCPSHERSRGGEVIISV